MPKVGDEEFAYTDEGIAAAQEKSEQTGIPMTNAMERNVTEYAGGGKTGYGKIGMYKEGDLVKEPRKRYSTERKVGQGKEVTSEEMKIRQWLREPNTWEGHEKLRERLEEILKKKK